MIILLSPAKTLDYDASVGNVPFTVPSLLPKSKQLIKILKSKNKNLKSLSKFILLLIMSTLRIVVLLSYLTDLFLNPFG